MEKKKKALSFKALVLIFLAVLIMTVTGDIIFKNSGSFFIKEATTENGRLLILVNSENKIPEDFQLKLMSLSNGERIDEEIYPSLQKMFDRMRKEGHYPFVRSGYRDSEAQQDIFESKYFSYRKQGYSRKQSRELTEDWVATPGTSEHETGLAVDINPDKDKSGAEIYAWLEKHAHEYGFIKRYPDDKREITGISNEPWHYRYVGKKAAKEMKRKNLCLEEYIQYISKHS